MTARMLSGREAADALLARLAPRVHELDPKLVVVQVGDDPASASYIKQKIVSCTKVGMRSEHRHLPAATTDTELFAVIDALNADADVSGFIVQLPLPPHLQHLVPRVIRAIDPGKDVDGFGAYNLGKTFLSKEFEHLPPATPGGIIALLEHYEINPSGMETVVIGRSNIVGKPLAVMLLNRDATVTVCHSKTPDLAAHTQRADLLIAAAGKRHLVTADMVRPGAVVIDVGMHRTEEGLSGDVDFAAVQAVAGAITPVPGGVGPMTVASLIRNCVTAKERQMSAAQN